MNKLMKQIVVGLSLLCGVSAFAQVGGAPIMRFMPLLSGYNVLVPTNSTVGLGTTNVLYTHYSGQVLYSLTNNSINGTVNSNLAAADAFKSVTLVSDVNGDVNANAAVVIAWGNTNWIPAVTTNSVGQYFVPPAGFTNASITTAYAGWPLASQAFPNWMYPATTNYYPTFGANVTTNYMTVTLYRSAWTDVQGGLSATLNPKVALWETTNSPGVFSFVVTAGFTNTLNNVPGVVITNLPIGWLQGARHVYATISTSAQGVGTNLAYQIVNQLGIIQPQP